MFDWRALAEGLQSTAGGVQNLLMSQYMEDTRRKKEQDQYNERFNQERQARLEDWRTQQAEDEERKIASEQREQEIWTERFEQQVDADKDLAEFRTKLGATYQQFDNNPEYAEMVKRFQSGQGSQEDMISLAGVQQIRMKQANFQPLSEEEKQFIMTLPVSMQNQLMTYEAGSEQFRQSMTLKREQMQKEMEYMKKIQIPYYGARIDYTEEATENIKGKAEKEATEDVEKKEDKAETKFDTKTKDLDSKITAIKKDIYNLESDEDFQLAEEALSRGAINPNDPLARKHEIDKARLVELKQILQGKEEELNTLRQNREKAKATKKTPETPEEPEEEVSKTLPPEVIEAIQAHPEMSLNDILKKYKEFKAGK